MFAQVFNSVATEFRPVDALVSDAGNFSRYPTVAEAKMDNWRSGFVIHVKGTIWVTNVSVKAAPEGAILIGESPGAAHLRLPCISTVTRVATAVG